MTIEPSATTIESSSTVLSTARQASTTTVSTLESAAPVAAEAQTVVIKDQPYYEFEDGTTSHFDVYHPSVQGDYPLVVLFHGNPVLLGATKESVRTLATTIAERGAVVVAPTWGHRMPTNDMSALAHQIAVWTNEQGPCAVWAAARFGGSVGGDHTRITVVGVTTGVLPAQAATFDPPPSVEGCLFAPVESPIEKAILFDTDWMLVPGIWDDVLAADPGFLDVSSYWDHVDSPTSTRVVMLAGEITAPETIRSLDDQTYAGSDWIRLRDPDGRLADAFASSGTLDDGSISFTDVTEVVVTLLVEGGWDAELRIVPGAGHSISGEAAEAFVADLVVAG